MKSPMILAGINIERARKIAFYLRHDQPLVYLFFRTLRVLNMLVEMITTEMKSIEIDQAYWRRIGAASPLEIYFARLCTHGPLNFVDVLLHTITGTQISSTNNEAEEVEYHLSVLRAKMNDLSCLVASVNEASGYLKRSFLVSNNRHYLYIICDISTSVPLKQFNSRWSMYSEDGKLLDNNTPSIPTNSKSHTTTSSRLLAPLRQLCVEDIDLCLSTLLKMLKRFRSKKFTPTVDGLSTPKIHSSSLRGHNSSSSLHRNGSNVSSGSNGFNINPLQSPKRSMNNLREQHSNTNPNPNANTNAHSNNNSNSNSPNNRHSSFRKQTIPNLNINKISPIEIEYIDNSYIADVNESLKSVIATIQDYAPHPKSSEYPVGFVDVSLRKPNYFDRFWIRWLVLTGLGLTGIYYIVNAYIDGTLQEFIQASIKNIAMKFQEKFIEPLDTLSHELFDSKFKEGIVVTKEELHQSYVALNRMLDDYSENVINTQKPSRAAQFQDIVDEAKKKFISKANSTDVQLVDVGGITGWTNSISNYVRDIITSATGDSPADIPQTSDVVCANIPDTVSATNNNTSTTTLTPVATTASTTPTTSTPVSSTSLLPLELDNMGTVVLAPTTPATGEEGCHVYKKLTALDIVEMQVKSSLVMDDLMKDYENELKSPIKGMVLGNLLRSMLIQLQKLKVHTEAAMLTMDQILASNEFTIAITAALPAFTAMGVCMKLIYGLFTTKNPKSGDSTLEVRLNMVEVERSLQNVFLYNTGDSAVDNPGYNPLKGSREASGTHVQPTYADLNSMNTMAVDGSFMNTDISHSSYLNGIFHPVPHANTATNANMHMNSSTTNSTSHHPFTIPEEEFKPEVPDYAPTFFASDTETESDFSGTESEVEVDGPVGPPGLNAHGPYGLKRSTSGGMELNIPIAHPRTRDMIQMSTQLRAKGMLYYRTLQLHKSLASLFLVHRPITRISRSIWDFFTLKIINNVNELMEWMCSDVENDPKPIETFDHSKLDIDASDSIHDNTVPIGLEATNDVTSYMPNERMNHKLAVISEYRNVHRDVLELIAPDYEISGQRKLATAIRMRNSYQCLAPPTH